MFIQYMVPGFELTTFGHQSPLITTRQGLPPQTVLFVQDSNWTRVKSN